jgi:uncharacterized membrane protein AbrB (regulator of aidB expression)
VRKTRSIIWGVFLITLGALLLAERFGHLHVPAGSLWPMILFVIGVAELAELRYGAAAFFMFLALVFLACTFGLFGMTYEKSWPLLMVIVGVSMVVRALTGATSRRRRAEEEAHHE